MRTFYILLYSTLSLTFSSNYTHLSLPTFQTGDEMSKRSKFVFCTWVGPNVSVMKKAKMSTDKALLKDIITNLSVELLVESAGEFTLEHFKSEVDKAGGAR